MMQTKMVQTKNSRLVFHILTIAAVLFFSAAFVPRASAQDACGDVYTVQPGDTLSEIAVLCGTTVPALVRANPQIVDPSLIFPGQQLALPGATLPNDAEGLDTYIVQQGDTLSEIAVMFDTTVAELLELNPQIEDPSLIFRGQRLAVPGALLPGTGGPAVEVTPEIGPPGTTLTVVGMGFPANTNVVVGAGVADSELQFSETINTGSDGAFTTQLTIPVTANPVQDWVVLAFTPGGGARATAEFDLTGADDLETYIVRPGDTLREIAARFDTTVQELLEVNPQITDPSLIFPGQRINLPESVILPGTGGGGEPVTTYRVQRGDTLSEIAVRFDTTVNALLRANPGIEDPNLIFAGQVLRIP